MAFWEKLLGKDSLQELGDVITNLELLSDAEAQISDFYKLCASAMPKEKDFWNHLADQELQHSDKVRQMLGRIARNPELYRPGISFSTVTIRMFDMGTQTLVEQMKKGSMPSDKLFAVGLEIEDSMVELGYSKLVKTEDAPYNMLAHQIDSESAEHKSAITSRMKAMTSQ